MEIRRDDNSRGTYPFNPTFRALSAKPRREILAYLLDHSEPEREDELSSYLTAIGVDQVDSVKIRLFHQHLPVLEAAGLLDWNRPEQTVETTAHPALGDPRFQRLLKTGIKNMDAAFWGLSHEHRRIVLRFLQETKGAITTTELAKEIRHKEVELTGRQPSGVDDLIVSLYHHHLPALAEKDLLDYDRDTSRAAYENHAALETVFRIICEPPECITNKLDGFLDGLQEPLQKARQDGTEQGDWPHFWREPHHG